MKVLRTLGESVLLAAWVVLDYLVTWLWVAHQWLEKRVAKIRARGDD